MKKRYEFKYALQGISLAEILEVIRLHPLGFRESYPQRKVNNFYMDTVHLDYFYQNIDGISKRRKFRYRWYGDLSTTSSAQLEIKNKENELGWKETQVLRPSILKTKDNLRSHFAAQNIEDTYLQPMLYNSYQRYYYESADKIFRITVDYDQKFGRPYLFDMPYREEAVSHNVVVELKFDEDEISRLDEVTRYLPYLRTKNSKYSNGITALSL